MFDADISFLRRSYIVCGLSQSTRGRQGGNGGRRTGAEGETGMWGHKKDRDGGTDGGGGTGGNSG